MDTLSAEILAKIFQKCSLGDRLLCLNLVNNRFRQCVPYSDLKMLDIPYLEKVSQKPDKERAREKHKFLVSIFECVIPKTGQNLRSVRFGKFDDRLRFKHPIEPETLLILHRMAPDLIEIDFGNRPVRIEALKLLPSFQNLSRLSIFGAGNDFDPILRKLRLKKLRIGGRHAPLMTADGTILRHLILQMSLERNGTNFDRDFFPTEFPSRISHRSSKLPQMFPNLEILDISHPYESDSFHDWPYSIAKLHSVPLGYTCVKNRTEYLNQFKKLRRSNLCGTEFMNSGSLVAYGADIVPYLKNVQIRLPIRVFGDVREKHNERLASRALKPWPMFLNEFQSMTSLLISNRSWQFDFKVNDLFHVLQLENLERLILDALDLTPMEAFLDQVSQFVNDGCKNGSVENSAFPIRSHGLKQLKIILPTFANERNEYYSRFYESEKSSGPKNVEESIQIYDIFVRFVLAKCDRIEFLELESLSSDGWNTLINFVLRRGDSCLLKSLRISCGGECHPISLEYLLNAKWPRLFELEILCKHSISKNTHQRWPSVSSSNEIREISKSFPRLSKFAWPPTANFEDDNFVSITTNKYLLIFNGFPNLKKVSLSKVEWLAFESKSVIGNHQALKKLVMYTDRQKRWNEKLDKKFNDEIYDAHRAMVKREGWRKEKRLEIIELELDGSTWFDWI